MEGINNTSSKKIIVIGDRILFTGMKLSGVFESYYADDKDSTEKILKECLEKEYAGMIIISQNLLALVEDKKLKYKVTTSIDPVVLPIPGYGEESLEDDTLRSLVMRAIGIDLISAKKQNK